MRPPLSVTGTRWTRWTPLSNLSRANTPWPATEATTSLKPPISDALAEISSTRQPLRLGIALVHAEQVAGEQRRLVAAGAGADLEHRRRARRRRRAAAASAPARARPRAAAPASSAISSLRHLRASRRSASCDHLARATSISARSRRTSRAAVGDGLELGIILGELDERVGRRDRGADIAACNSSRRASMAAIRSAEMRVIEPSRHSRIRERRDEHLVCSAGCESPDRAT